MQRPSPKLYVCVFQTEIEGERIEGVDAALCTVDRDSQVRSKEGGVSRDELLGVCG